MSITLEGRRSGQHTTGKANSIHSFRRDRWTVRYGYSLVLGLMLLNVPCSTAG